MPKLELTYKELPPCDVLVAGGGSAGVSAAISSARGGAKTILRLPSPPLIVREAGAGRLRRHWSEFRK